MDSKRKLSLTIIACLAAVGVAAVAVTVYGVAIRTVFLVGMVALCPLMHLFMGHGSHREGSHEHSSSEAVLPPAEEPGIPARDDI